MPRTTWSWPVAARLVVALVAAGASGCGSGGDSDSARRDVVVAPPPPPPATTPTPTATTQTPAARPKARPRRPRPLAARLKALGATIARITTKNELTLVAKAPEGALDGATTGLGTRAGEIFRAVYRYARPTRGTVVVFRGRVPELAGGRDHPADSVLAIYNIRRTQAAEIDWSSADAMVLVDWTQYLLTVHPALR